MLEVILCVVYVRSIGLGLTSTYIMYDGTFNIYLLLQKMHTDRGHDSTIACAIGCIDHDRGPYLHGILGNLCIFRLFLGFHVIFRRVVAR